MNNVGMQSDEIGLSLNCKQRDCKVKVKESSRYTLKVRENSIEQGNEYTERSELSILRDRMLTMDTKLRALSSYAYPILMHACDSGTISRSQKPEVGMLRRPRLSRTEYVRNEGFIRRVGMEKCILILQRKRQLNLFF